MLGNITLYMKHKESTAEPIKLVIDDTEYIYGEDSLFENLISHKGKIIRVINSGTRNSSKEYFIGDVTLGDNPSVNLINAYKGKKC